jgi:hypothetical protein
MAAATAHQCHPMTVLRQRIDITQDSRVRKWVDPGPRHGRHRLPRAVHQRRQLLRDQDGPVYCIVPIPGSRLFLDRSRRIKRPISHSLRIAIHRNPMCLIWTTLLLSVILVAFRALHFIISYVRSKCVIELKEFDDSKL